MYYSFDEDSLDSYLDGIDYLSPQALFEEDEIDFAARRRSTRGIIPRRLRGISPNVTHWWKVANIRNRIRRWFPGVRVLVDKDRREGGRPASKKRPDIQFRHPQRHRATHVEVDTERRSMNQHIAERDPRRRGVYVLIDGNTGRVIEKQIFPAGSQSPSIRQGELRRSDVFEEFDADEESFDWNTPRRWGCKARCSWLHESCKSGCGFNYSCYVDCARDLQNCIGDCDRRYP